jgi:hypothetical protein
MTPDEWPPGEGGGATTPGSADHQHHHQITGHHPGMFDFTARRPHLGLYTAGWKAGFKAGAGDALRVVGRRLPVEHWHVVEALVDKYSVAGSDE